MLVQKRKVEIDKFVKLDLQKRKISDNIFVKLRPTKT